jgi:hypothetical protein
LGGTVTGSGTLVLAGSNGAETYSLQSGLGLMVGTVQLDSGDSLYLNASASYAGTLISAGNGYVDLNSHSLSVSGSLVAEGGVLEGPGTLLVSGAASLYNVSVFGAADLNINGTADQSGTMQIGEQSSGSATLSAATLNVLAEGVYTLDAAAQVAGNGTLSVAGSLMAATDSTMVLSTILVDSGVISANLGTLDITGPVTGAGIFSIGKAGLLEFGQGNSIGAATSIDFTTGGGELELTSAANFAATLSGFATGDIIEMSNISPGSISGTYGTTHDQIIVSDTQGDSVTLNFSTAQTLSQLSFTTGPHGFAAVVHL